MLPIALAAIVWFFCFTLILKISSVLTNGRAYVSFAFVFQLRNLLHMRCELTVLARFKIVLPLWKFASLPTGQHVCTRSALDCSSALDCCASFLFFLCDNDSFSVVGEVRFHSTPRIFVNLVLADWWDAHWLGIAQRREDITSRRSDICKVWLQSKGKIANASYKDGSKDKVTMGAWCFLLS